MNYLFQKLEESFYHQHEAAFFIFVKEELENNLMSWQAGSQDMTIAYSLKANYDAPLLSYFGEKCEFLEVASWYECEMAQEYISSSKIIINGPIYSRFDLSKIIDSGSLLIIDSLVQLKVLKTLSTTSKKPRIGVRIRLNNFPSSRFGISEDEIALFKTILPSGWDIEMVHCHYCDGFRSVKSFNQRLFALESVRASHFSSVTQINIGGGFYSVMPNYLAKQFHESIPSISDYVLEIQKSFPQNINVITEIGAALVANAVDYCCKVVDVKQIDGKSIVVTNGSKWDIKPNGSPKNLPLEVYSNNKNEQVKAIQIVGYTCMENDVLFDGEMILPSIGDYLVFKNCGAYAQSLSPDFIQQKKQVVNAKELI